MRVIAIIPARYASSRFPGKPLARIGGVEMIVRVCRQAAKAVDEVVVATDDTRISRCVEQNGFKAILTSPHHKSGTDRVMEAYNSIRHTTDDVIINVQGDEPFIAPEQIRQLSAIFEDRPDTRIATLLRRFDKSLGFEALFDPNLVKATRNAAGDAICFSRSIIPYVRGHEWKEWLDYAEFHTHIGIYAYRAQTLAEITKLPQSPLEIAESLEQMRWIEAGYRIATAVSDYRTIGIDTPDDLAAAEEYLRL